MKLIDLLVQELPKHGGWPEVNYVSGLHYLAGVLWIPCYPEQYKPGGTANEMSLRYQSGWVARSCEDQKEEVNKLQYEAALAASKNLAWNGEGIPPAGTECEVEWSPGSWEPCKVTYVGKYHVVVEKGEAESAFDIWKVDFRPLNSMRISEFDTLCRPLIKWINDNANPHAIIVIDGTSAVLYSGEKSVLTEEYVKD